jgi:hypothetical protein
MKLINAGIELATLFQRYARKVLMREGEGIMKIPSKKKVNDFAENIYQDFKSSGVPNNVIKTEKDIGKFHKQITDIEEKARKKWWDNQLKKPPELADIFDLQGNQIRDTSKIMGGKEIPTGIKTLNTVPEKKGMSGYEYEIKNPKKLDPALYEDRGGNIIPAQFGIHPNSEIAKSLRLEAEAAKKLKNMSEAEIKLRGNRPYDTDEQILARLKKQNKESNVAGMRPTDDTLNKLVDEHSSNLEKLRQTDAEGGTAIGYEEFKALQKRNAQIEEVIKNARKVENETEEQILNKLNKGNKESIERLKNKPLDPDVVLPNYNETPGAYSRRKTPGSKENLLQELKIAYEKEFNRLRGDETAEELKEILKNLDTDGVPFAAGGRAGGVAGLLGERTGYAVGNQVMPAVDPRMNVDYNTLVDQNTAQRATQAQARNPVLQRMQQNQANQTSFGDRVGFTQHMNEDRMLKDANIENQLMNRMGGLNGLQNPFGPGIGMTMLGGASGLYQGVQSLLGDQSIGEALKDTYENTMGPKILSNPEQLAQYNQILNRPAEAAETSAMPQGSPGQLNPTPTPDAGTNLTQYSNIPELTRLINDNSNINSLAEANDYLKMQTAYEDFLGIGPGQKYQLRGNEISLEDFKKNVYDPNKQTLAYGGRAGLYQGGQAQIEPDLSGIGHGSDALMARNMLIAPGSQATTSTGLNYLLGEDNDTTRVPYKEKGSVTLADLIKVNASGNKSGKNQIMGAPDGITADTETFNAIIKMNIPIMEKINLLGSYGYGKDRFKVEKGNKELFLGEGGYKDRNIGLGVNQGGEGLSGSVIRNLETGDNDYQLKFLKSFAEGGRAGYNEGNMVLPKPKAMDEYLLQQVMSQAGANTLDVRTREMFIEELKKKIRDKRATEEKRYQFEELRDQGAEDMYYNNREKELDIKYNPQNYPPSMRKFAGGGLAGLLGEGPGSTDHGPRTFNQGERVPMLYGGGIYKVIIENLSKLRKIKPSEYLKLRNYKSLPTNVKNLMPKTELEKLKEARIEMVENLVDMATTSKSYEKNIKNLADEFSKMGLDGDDYLNMMRKDLKSPVPFGVTDKDILQGELILKNLKTKGNRQLNAQGGRIGYEEAGVVDKIGGMVNYKNVPHYLAKPLKGVTNIAEWMGRLPFATAELASDIIRKPLFKPGDRVPGLPGLGARFVGDETFKKFINNMTTGALAENLGLTALADKTGENLTDEARTVGDILESLGEFANAGGLLAAGKNLLKGKGVGDVVKKIKKRLKENKDEALTAQGEGRRDFNKTAAAGAGVIALKSMGLGSLTKQTKKLDDIQIQVRGDQDYDYADEMWNGSTWANIQFKALTKKGTEILEDLTKAKGSTLTKEGGLYTPVGGSEEAAMIVQKLKPKAGLQLHMATNQVYNPATKSFSHPKGSIQEAAGKEHNKIYSGKDINKKKIMKEADDMIAHDSGGYSSMQFHDEYLDDILEQLAVK